MRNTGGTLAAGALEVRVAWALGISSYYHDSAAALVCDGEIVAAAQEERFSRKKHDSRFPRRAINYCLAAAFIEPSQLGAVIFYDNPALTLDRVMKNAISVAPGGREEFSDALCALLGTKARLADELEIVLGGPPRLLFSHHHMAHAASCFYPSPYEEAAILTIDGGRMGDVHAGRRPEVRNRTSEGNLLPAFARPSLQRLHLFLRLQGQLR